MANPNTVLIVSYQADLMKAHAEALTASGYAVTTVSSMSAGLGAVGPGQYALLIIAPTTPTGDRRRIEGEARRRNARIRIVLMYSGQQEKDVFANAFIDIDSDPANLVETVRSLLSAS